MKTPTDMWFEQNIVSGDVATILKGSMRPFFDELVSVAAEADMELEFNRHLLQGGIVFGLMNNTMILDAVVTPQREMGCGRGHGFYDTLQVRRQPEFGFHTMAAIQDKDEGLVVFYSDDDDRVQRSQRSMRNALRSVMGLE